MKNFKFKDTVKTLLSAIFSVGVLLAAGVVQAEDSIASQKPLMLSIGVPPNILLTLDESGSMSWGYIPDTGMTAYKNLIGSYNNKRYHAFNTNPMAYNPHVIYEIPPAFNEDGTKLDLKTYLGRNVGFTAAPTNGFGVVQNSYNPVKNLSTGYRPIHEHRIPSQAPIYASHPNDNTASWTNTTSGRQQNTAAYYYEFDSANSSCNIDSSDAGGESCYRYIKVEAGSAYDKNNNRLRRKDGTLVDGRENFAIWYSFYRSRALATLSAASIAFADLDGQVRFAWQNLKTCTFEGLTANRNSLGSCNPAGGLRQYGDKHRGDFYTWLRKLYFNVGTPLPNAMKRAGEFLKEDVAWQLNPGGSGNTSENMYACRPSYHVLMTDGMWNETATSPDSFRSDHTTFNTPGGIEKDGGSYENFAPNYFNKQKPFYDNSNKTTLADFAMHYWATDLRPDLDNRIPTHIPYKHANENDEYWDARNNPAEWQHMTNFIMGLGLTTSLSNANIPWHGSTHEGQGYQNLLASTSWPAASSGSANNVYDLWHAAINSRGEFYSVDSPDAMVAAFRDIIGRIAVRQSTAALPVITSVVMEDEDEEGNALSNLISYFYQSSYDSNFWSGDLIKSKKEITFSNGVRSETVTEEWRASQELPAHDVRTIKMVKNGSLVDFKTTNATEELKAALNNNPVDSKTDTRWAERLNYIRGDQSKETGTNAFRERASLLGDFLGSQPAMVAGARYLEGFANKIEGNNKYTKYVSDQKQRRKQIYVGGNAGMLHAFDVESGEEKFAFVPTAIFNKLHHLVNPEYNHYYYVDGTPVIADVYDGTNWRTVLIGTLGAGGRGIFALDVTNPDSIELLWEIGPNNADYADMGYSVPKPTVARLHSGEWAVVAGNGYGGKGYKNGKASLYAINVIDGTLIKRFDVTGTVKDGSLTVPNGLSTPKLVDFDADGVADYAYAGDLQGNLWRFDLLGHDASGSNTNKSIYGGKNSGTTKFAVSYNGKPMFTAKASNGGVQPITAPPSIVRHPNRTGYLVVVGTGKYVAGGDKAGITSYAQSLYGIWDEKTKAENTLATTLDIKRSNLQEQSFFNEEVSGVNKVVGVTREARLLSQNAVSWGTQKGWRLDLALGNGYVGEMIVNGMQAIGNTVLLQTLVPNDDPCAHGAGNWLYAINPATGGRTERHVFDTRNADSDHNVQVVSGIKFGDPGGVPLNFTSGGLEVPSSGGPEGINISDMTGRQTWRMLSEP